ncbi:MAG: DUF4931 domain-containing protein [Elusimicrobiales bacterium]
MTPELRRDPIIGRWVIIASGRRLRPSDFKPEAAASDDVSKCPFCPGREADTPAETFACGPARRKPGQPGWTLRVVGNKFPALDPAGRIHRHGVGMYDEMDGAGAHEVIIETPHHVRHIADMEDCEVEDIFRAYRHRMLAAAQDKRLQYALVFKNYGRAAGATLSHPHSQLIALPMVPIRVRQEMDGSKAYHDYKERCVFCDIIREERRFAERIVCEDGDFIAMEPYASRFQFETWILPKEHSGHYERISAGGIKNLARLMKTVMAKLRRATGGAPFNWMLHTMPLRDHENAHYHWHIELMPKTGTIAGFEWGSGCYINSLPPELAAKTLNET